MTHLKRIIATAVMAIFMVACGHDSNPDPLYDVSAAPTRYASVAQTFAREALASGAPGAVLGIIENGQLTYAVGVGQKVPGKGPRVEPTTLFRIGSVTKMMTSLALMQEVQAGRLKLDDAVTQHVPGFRLASDDASRITVRQLLDQTSGLADYLEINAPAAEQTDAALATFLTGRYASIGYLNAPPGTFYNYSNPNFMLAGLIAEMTSGVPYRQLMHDRVFIPLGMSRTYFTQAEVLADGDFAEGKTVADPAAGIPARVLPGSYENPWARPAGYGWSNVQDLARFATFLFDGAPAVLSSTLHAEMTNPTHPTYEFLDLTRYGYGLQSVRGLALNGWRPVKVLQHGGDINGFSSYVFVLPELRFAVVMLASGDNAQPFGETLAEALRNLVTLPSAEPMPGFEPDPATFQEEVGTYRVGHLGIDVTVTLVSAGDASPGAAQLRIDIPAAANLGVTYDPVLVPSSLRNFQLTMNGSPTNLTFIHGADGSVWLRNRLWVGKRVH